MPRDDIGRVPCPMCRRSVPVRKNRKGRLYMYCGPTDGYPGCGMLQPNLPGGQDWILEHATMNGPDGPPACDPAGGEAAPPEPTPEKKPPPKKRSFLESLLTLD